VLILDAPTRRVGGQESGGRTLVITSGRGRNIRPAGPGDSEGFK
jgi:hypothetical protein